MKISFCTTCLNRLEQFRQTFDINLTIISKQPDVEWIIVNLNSNDSLHEFIVERLPDLPESVVYAKENINRFWHMSVAKNISHRLGSGDFLINLDCDNFIGNTLDLIRDPLARGAKAIHLWSGIHRDGTSGRTAFAREVFHMLGGYDESFFPVAYEELDLLKRAKKSGVLVEHCPCMPHSALKNEKAESIKYCGLEKGVTWDTCAKNNERKSISNLMLNRLTANEDRKWGYADLELFRGGSRHNLKPLSP